VLYTMNALLRSLLPGGHGMDGTPKWNTPLEQRMQHANSRLSSRRRELLENILENAEETYYLSSRKMARKYGVDAATIVRTIQVLGYERFAEFASDLRSYFITRISPYRTMKSATGEGRSVEGHVQKSLEMDRANFDALRESVPPERVVELARKLIKARQIVVVGVDLAYSPAWFLAYNLSWLGLHAEVPVGSSGNLHHRVRGLGAGDIVVAISFGRCLRDTVEAARVARERRAWTFGITDASNSPIAMVCHDHWVISVTSPSFNGSYVAVLGALNALQVACAHVRSRRSLQRLREIDREEAAVGRWYTPNLATEKERP
jgi:DNA-binding MurR/RpiR family transcriptional regulator